MCKTGKYRQTQHIVYGICVRFSCFFFNIFFLTLAGHRKIPINWQPVTCWALIAVISHTHYTRTCYILVLIIVYTHLHTHTHTCNMQHIQRNPLAHTSDSDGGANKTGNCLIRVGVGVCTCVCLAPPAGIAIAKAAAGGCEAQTPFDRVCVCVCRTYSHSQQRNCA